MKILKFALSLVLASGFAACSQIDPIPRNQLATNLAPILDIEKRLDRARYYAQIIGSLGGISDEKSEELKEHYDIYYVYYLASNVHLAKGELEYYLAHVKLAERELDAIEAIFNELAKDGELDSSRKSESSWSKL